MLSCGSGGHRAPWLALPDLTTQPIPRAHTEGWLSTTPKARALQIQGGQLCCEGKGWALILSTRKVLCISQSISKFKQDLLFLLYNICMKVKRFLLKLCFIVFVAILKGVLFPFYFVVC